MNYVKISKPKEYFFINKFGKYLHSDNFIIQYHNETSANKSIECSIRLGITASKKTGNAVNRNLIKRRLKTIFSNAIKNRTTKYLDFIIIGKKKYS
jgi:ribonuclease P protein component